MTQNTKSSTVQHATLTDEPRMMIMIHRRSQDFLWGALFFLKKVDDFLVAAMQAKTAEVTAPTLQISPPTKNERENLTSCSA